jgi:hypothetical protein
MLNFITTGCSFTAGTIPLPHDTPEDWSMKGSIWNHFCFAEMDPANDRFTNLALSGGGNIASTTNLIYYLETNKKHVTPDNTLIGLNITGTNRQDIICSLNNRNINTNLCCVDTQGLQHVSKELGFGWITNDNEHTTEHIDIQSCLALLQCFSYLELNKFRYFFMLMNSAVYTQSPQWFQSAIDDRNVNWIKFDGIAGMMELAVSKKLTRTQVDLHPNIEGHKLISQYVIDFIKQQYQDVQIFRV